MHVHTHPLYQVLRELQNLRLKLYISLGCKREAVKLQKK